MPLFVLGVAAENARVFEIPPYAPQCSFAVGRFSSALYYSDSITEARLRAHLWCEELYPRDKGWRFHTGCATEIPLSIVFSDTLWGGVIAASKICRLMEETSPRVPVYARYNTQLEAIAHDGTYETAVQHALGHLEQKFPHRNGYFHYTRIGRIMPSYMLASARQNIRAEQTDRIRKLRKEAIHIEPNVIAFSGRR